MCENRFDSSESSAIGQKQRPSSHCKFILETKNSGLSIHFLEVTTYLVVGRGEASAPRCFRSLMSKRNWSFTKHDSCVESCVSDVHVCARTYVYMSTHALTHVYMWRSFHGCCPSCVLRQRPLSWNLPCRQGYVASKPQGSTCLNSPSAGIKKINHYFWLFCVGPVEQPHIS